MLRRKDAFFMPGNRCKDTETLCQFFVTRLHGWLVCLSVSQALQVKYLLLYIQYYLNIQVFTEFMKCKF